MFTTKEISQMIHVSEETVRRWIRNRELQATQSGKSYLVSKEELINFIEEKSKSGSATSIGKMAKFLPYYAKGGAIAGEALIKTITKRIQSKSADPKHTEEPDHEPAPEEIEAHLDHLKRRKKKLELEYQLHMIDIEDEIANYQRLIQS